MLAGFVQELYILATSSGGDLISKEAVYAALGANTTKLEQMIDFSSWLTGEISHAASLRDPACVRRHRPDLTASGKRCYGDERSGCSASGRRSR